MPAVDRPTRCPVQVDERHSNLFTVILIEDEFVANVLPILPAVHRHIYGRTVHWHRVPSTESDDLAALAAAPGAQYSALRGRYRALSQRPDNNEILVIP